MASFLDKFKVATGIDTNTTMDLSCQHLTTANWMEAQPVYIKECVPGENIKIHQETFARLEPLVVPTLGRALIHNRAFFVPMRTIMKNWDEFITDTSSSYGVDFQRNSDVSTLGPYVMSNKVPQLRNQDIVKLFCYWDAVNNSISTTPISTNFATVVPTGSSYDNVDIVLQHKVSASNVVDYGFNLTASGRRVMKFLQSLGYSFVWAGLASTSAVWTGVPGSELNFSALPLLAYWKVIYDWYYPSQFIGNSIPSRLKLIFDNVSSRSDNYYLGLEDLHYFFSQDFNGKCCYDSDYFTSSFTTPDGPASSQAVESNVVIDDITKDVSSAYSATGFIGVNGYSAINQNTPYYVPTVPQGSTDNLITQYGLNTLKALTDYMKRHQLAGARAMDRLYARFGKAVKTEKLDRSYYFGSDNIPLQIGDVMSHADTAGSSLGDYAGKGMAYGSNGSYEFSTGDEYGYVIVISSIIPQIGYYQGLDRNVLHIGKRDFWTPEFDQVGNQAISRMELFMPMNPIAETLTTQSSIDFTNPDLVNGVFGWTPRYAEYKIGRDKMTGDFRYRSMNQVGNNSSAWNLMRSVGRNWQQASDMTNSEYFVQAFDSNQYNRLFGNINDTADKFYMIHNFNVVSNAPMHSLFDTYEFESEDEGAKYVTTDVNGVKVN